MNTSSPSVVRADAIAIDALQAGEPWAPEFLAQVRARVPYRQCCVCGESIGAARLTLRPEAQTCAWCGATGADTDPARRLAA